MAAPCGDARRLTGRLGYTGVMSALRPLVIALAATLIAASPLVGTAWASAPYPATVTGCVTNGALIGAEI